MFLTNHARVLLCVARDPGMRLRDIAATSGITERSAFGIMTDLTEAAISSSRRTAAVTATRFRRTSCCRSPRAGSAASATYSPCWPWTSATAAPAKYRDTGSTAATRTVPPGLRGASHPCRGHRRVPHRGGQRGGCAAHPGHRPAGDRGRVPDTAITVWSSAQGPAQATSSVDACRATRFEHREAARWRRGRHVPFRMNP
jgi:hypothetical protein